MTRSKNACKFISMPQYASNEVIQCKRMGYCWPNSAKLPCKVHRYTKVKLNLSTNLRPSLATALLISFPIKISYKFAFPQMINVQSILIVLDIIAKQWYVERISFITYLVWSHILALTFFPTPFTEVPSTGQLNFTTLPIGTKGLSLKPRRTFQKQPR
jgi:hypothetical protein